MSGFKFEMEGDIGKKREPLHAHLRSTMGMKRMVKLRILDTAGTELGRNDLQAW